MLMLLPKLRPFRVLTAQKTDPAKLAFAKDKLLLLAQSGLFSVEFNEFQSGIHVKRFCRIVDYSPFIGPVGIACSTKRIQR